MLKVLIADDDDIFSAYLQSCVDWAALGTELAGRACDGSQVIELASALKPDIIVMDIEMPGMNGLECIEQLESLHIQTRIILVTGHNKFEYAQRAAGYGVADILLKPVSSHDMEQTVGRVVSRCWSERIARSAIKGRTAFVSLVEGSRGGILGLASTLLSAIRQGKADNIRSALDSYLISADEPRLPFNCAIWLHIFPALLCAELIRNIPDPKSPSESFSDLNALYDRIQQAYLAGHCHSLLLELCNEASASLCLPGSNSTLAEEIYRNILQNYSNPKFNMSMCAETMHFSKVYLGRVFKSAYGKSPSAALKDIRMAEARRLLSAGGLQVQQIAQRVGFEDSSYFSKAFKAYYGFSPSESQT